jgi:hypothetical protein
MLVGAYFGRPVHFLVRGDMFGNRLKRWILRNFNILPIHRLEEGYEHVHKNEETFQAVNGILKKDENLIIFGEGTSVTEKRLRPLRKGIARIAFGAEEAYNLDIHVVPVGINYTYPTKFRQEVMIRFHEPIRIQELMDLYKENHAKAYLSFNRLLETAMREEMIIVEDSKNDKIAEYLFEIDRNNNPQAFFKWKSESDDRLTNEKNIADKINKLSENPGSEFHQFVKMVSDYFGILENKSIKDKCIAGKVKLGWIRNLAFGLGWPVFLYGYLTNIISFILPKYISDRNIKQPQFYMAVFMGIGTVLYMFYFPLIMVLFGLLFGWKGLIIGASFPFAGYMAIYYMEIWRDRIDFFRYKSVKRNNKDLIADLKAQRRNICSSFKEL